MKLAVSVLHNSNHAFQPSIQHVSPQETYETIVELNKKKGTSGNISTKTLKTIARNVCLPLTDLYKLIYFKWCFSWWTKISRCDTSLWEKGSWRQNKSPTNKRTSKVCEVILDKQLNSFFETKLSPYLCGFRSSYVTQHALSNL